MYIATD